MSISFDKATAEPCCEQVTRTMIILLNIFKTLIMKNLKLGLFSLLAILAVSVFLTNREHFERAKKHIKIRDGQFVLTESAKSEKFTDEQYKEIVSHLEYIKKQVLNGQHGITAEDILDGKEYTITYQSDEQGSQEKAGCTGETKAEVTYTFLL